MAYHYNITPTQRDLIEFIGQHGFMAWPSGLDSITALAPYTRNGRLFHTGETFPALYGRTRDWLGY